MVGDRGWGLGVEGERAIGTLFRIPELLRYPHVVCAPRSVLRRKHADAVTVANLVDVIAHVNNVEPDRIRQSVPAIGKLMRQAGIELPIGWQVVAVGAANPIRCRPQAAAVDKGCARGGAVQPGVGISPPVCNPSRTRNSLIMVGVDEMGLEIDQVVWGKQGLV